jgi:Tol biopolymer transport system component
MFHTKNLPGPNFCKKDIDMIQKTSIAFTVIFISLIQGVFFCGCKSQIPKDIPSTVTPAVDIRPQWNPDGSQIVFASDRDGNQEIYVVDANGSNQIRLTNNSNLDNYPKWSPDGSKIAYLSLKERQNDIYIMNSDGSNQIKLTENARGVWFGSWSPDGKKMVFNQNKDGNQEIYIIDADGANQTKLTDNPLYDGNPYWSPDGSKIVYVALQEAGNFDIFTMATDGSNKIRLTDNSAREGNPVWTPDSSRIVFESRRDGNREIHIINTDGSNQTRLTGNLFGLISFFPDGSRIVFASQKDEQVDIFSMGLDGSDLKRLTSHPANDRMPVWSPDGKKIVFFSDRLLMGMLGDIYVLDEESRDIQNLTNNDIIPGKEIRDIKYGKYERNALDLWLAEIDEPTPLVVYYHPGGFFYGDKRSMMPVPLLLKLLEAGISVAGVNYRLIDTAPFPAQMLDSARALQFIRHHAEKHNVDPSRIGAMGVSAGAIISMWLAFHDDMADTDNEDPILRESTRLTAVVPEAGPTSAEPGIVQELFNTDQIAGNLIQFFGMSGPEDFQNPKFFPLFEKASPINHTSSDDPPVYMYYWQPNLPLPPNSTIQQYAHHPKWGIYLKEKLEILGVECILKFKKDYPDGPPVDEYVKFFREKFGMNEKKN